MLITLKGGLRDGATFNLPSLASKIQAPGAYEHGLRYWNEDHYVYSFPTEIYVKTNKPNVYAYDHTEPARTYDDDTIYLYEPPIKPEPSR
jgi:hypothetical protein